MTRDQQIAALTFAAAVLALAATQAFVPDNIKPYLTFGVGIINLALSIFFGAVKPLAAAFLKGHQAALEEALKAPQK